MKKSTFLIRLNKEGSLELVEPSDEIAKSYLIKSEKCHQVARLAYDAEIYENAVSGAYYGIYNSVHSLFFRCGIKCENHAGAHLLIKDLFKQELHQTFSEFKKDRIDNQYYIPQVGSEPIQREKCAERIRIAIEFCAQIRAYSNNLKLQEITAIRKKCEEMVVHG